jgi:hypothetical protein
MMQSISYSEARGSMLPGDVIAFGGKGGFSSLIKRFTFSPVSHVGSVLQTNILGNEGGRFFNNIIESTSLGDFNGVQVSRVSERLRDYDGDIWWLPLKKKLRQYCFDEQAYFDFMFENDRKPYDTTQAILSALDLLPDSKEDYDKFFCSELVAAALKAAGTVVNNSSEITPIDLCRWDIYESEYFLLKGDPKEIPGFNSRSPEPNS